MLGLFIATPTMSALGVFFQVVFIDLTLAGDNAVAVGMAAAGLPRRERRRAIIFGMGAAVLCLITFAVIAVQLMNIIGLLFAGGLLLLYVCYKMWGDLREHHTPAEPRPGDFGPGGADAPDDPTISPGEAALEDATGGPHRVGLERPAAPERLGERIGAGVGASGRVGRPKTFRGAMLQILLADISMSLDNVLAVAGAARHHPWVMAMGLVLSIGITAIAAAWIARLLHRVRWLGYAGLALVFWVSLTMLWAGHRDVVERLGWTGSYNAAVPEWLEIRAMPRVVEVGG